MGFQSIASSNVTYTPVPLVAKGALPAIPSMQDIALTGWTHPTTPVSGSPIVTYAVGLLCMMQLIVWMTVFDLTVQDSSF